MGELSTRPSFPRAAYSGNFCRNTAETCSVILNSVRGGRRPAEAPPHRPAALDVDKHPMEPVSGGRIDSLAFKQGTSRSFRGPTGKSDAVAFRSPLSPSPSRKATGGTAGPIEASPSPAPRPPVYLPISSASSGPAVVLEKSSSPSISSGDRRSFSSGTT